MSPIFLRIPAWLVAIALFVFTIVPASERPSTGVPHDVEHVLAFGLLGVLVGLGYPSRVARVISGTLIYTLLIELSQIPLPTRHARLSDFLFDTLAIWSGIAVIYCLPKRWLPQPQGSRS